MKTIGNLNVMTREDFDHFCPSFLATAPKSDVSDKYSFISTENINMQLNDLGWFPTYAREARANDPSNKGLTRHVVRWSHKDYQMNGERIELVGINSHNRAAAFKFMAGIFRLVCSNGLIAKTSDLGEVTIKHMGNQEDQVQQAVSMISSNAQMIAGKVDTFKAIELSLNEQNVFASAAHEYIYPEKEKAPIESNDLLIPRRYGDNGDDLWTTFNKIQENTMKGGISGRTSNGRRYTTRQVKDITKDVKLNQALWSLTEQMAKIKSL